MIDFQVKNTSKSELYINVGLERFEGSKWNVVSDDIFNNTMLKRTKMILLKSGESDTVRRWNPKPFIQLNKEKSNYGKFRFSFRTGSDLDQMKDGCYSNDFTIVPQ